MRWGEINLHCVVCGTAFRLTNDLNPPRWRADLGWCCSESCRVEAEKKRMKRITEQDDAPLPEKLAGSPEYVHAPISAGCADCAWALREIAAYCAPEERPSTYYPMALEQIKLLVDRLLSGKTPTEAGGETGSTGFTGARS